MKTISVILFSILFLSGCDGEKIVYLTPHEAAQKQEEVRAKSEKYYYEQTVNRLPFNTELIKAIGNYWYIVKFNNEYFYARDGYRELVLCPCNYTPETK